MAFDNSGEYGLPNVSGKNCYPKMLEDDAVIASLRPLIDAVSIPTLYLSAPCDPELDEYLRIFMMYSDIGNVKREVIGETLVYGAAVITFNWKVINGGCCDGWVIPVECACQGGENLTFVQDYHSRDVLSIKGSSGIDLPNSESFIFLNSILASDKCGRSILEPAVTLWKLKHEVYGHFMNWLRLFSNPAIQGNTAEDSEVICEYDEEGEIVSEYDPVQGLYDQLSQYGQGSVFSLPYGYDVKLIQPNGNGLEFMDIIDRLDIRISRAITSQSLATHTSAANSRAAAEVHDLMIKRAVQSQLENYKSNVKRVVIQAMTRAFGDYGDICRRVANLQMKWLFEEEIEIDCSSLKEIASNDHDSNGQNEGDSLRLTEAARPDPPIFQP